MKSALSRHRGRQGDSLDALLAAEEMLAALSIQWEQNHLAELPRERAAIAAYERGNIVKLVLEHGALRAAAQRDVVLTLRRRGQQELAVRVGVESQAVREELDSLDEESRGVQAASLGASARAAASAAELLRLCGRDAMLERRALLGEVRRMLGRRASGLRSERFVYRHAPVHPAAEPEGLKMARPLLWLRARWDRLREFPWVKESPFKGRKSG